MFELWRYHHFFLLNICLLNSFLLIISFLLPFNLNSFTFCMWLLSSNFIINIRWLTILRADFTLNHLVMINCLKLSKKTILIYILVNLNLTYWHILYSCTCSSIITNERRFFRQVWIIRLLKFRKIISLELILLHLLLLHIVLIVLQFTTWSIILSFKLNSLSCRFFLLSLVILNRYIFYLKLLVIRSLTTRLFLIKSLSSNRLTSFL